MSPHAPVVPTPPSAGRKVVPTPPSAVRRGGRSGVPPLGGVFAVIALAAALALTACQCCNPTTAPATAPTPFPRDDLAELARGHSDKIQFAWYATTFHRLDPPVKDFVNQMSADNKRLLATLTAWAAKNKVDLTFNYSDDASGRARKMMEKSQEAVIRSDAPPDFQRDLLIQMWQDYDWNRSLAQTLLKTTTDPDLKTYLGDSVRTHNAGIKTIRDLLARYKFE